MKKKTITLEFDGWWIKGHAVINMWGGGQGEIRMDPYFIPANPQHRFARHGTESFRYLLINGINDGQFGCESIESASLIIYESYGRHEVYDRNIEIDRKLIQLYNPKLKKGV